MAKLNLLKLIFVLVMVSSEPIPVKLGTSALRLIRSSFRHHNMTWSEAMSKSLLPLGRGGGAGDYLVSVELGTPRKSFYLAIDTGSDITWVPCNPCVACSEEVPKFEPLSSTTYKYLTCASSTCQSLDLEICSQSGNSKDVNCTDDIEYLDNSEATVLMSNESLTVAGKEVQNFVFGCASEMKGKVGKSLTPGILGLGRGPLSFRARLVAGIQLE